MWLFFVKIHLLLKGARFDIKPGDSAEQNYKLNEQRFPPKHDLRVNTRAAGNRKKKEEPIIVTIHINIIV